MIMLILQGGISVRENSVNLTKIYNKQVTCVSHVYVCCF